MVLSLATVAATLLLVVALSPACSSSKAPAAAASGSSSQGSLLQIVQSTDTRTIALEKSLASLTQSDLTQAQEIKQELRSINAKLIDIQARLKAVEDKLK